MRILWIPHTGWHIPQRAHLFCHSLADRHEVHVTNWVADFSSIKDYFSRRYLRNFSYRRFVDGKITVHGIPRISPALFSPMLRKFNISIFSRFVQKIIDENQIDVVVGTFVVPPPRVPRLVFDLFDDNVGYWRYYGRNKSYAEEIQSTEQAYLDHADAVLCASSVLKELALQRGARGTLYWLPNGVDIQQFDVTEIPKHNPIMVGLIGNHDRPIELYKVIKAAQALPEFLFRIAGRGSALPAAQVTIGEYGIKNIIFDGEIDMEKISKWMQTVDIGLCPYQKTLPADASSPMRLLQYSAAGLPVVCTKLEEVQRIGFSNVILVDDGVENLVDGIRQAASLLRSRPLKIFDYDLPHLVARCEAILRGDSI